MFTPSQAVDFLASAARPSLNLNQIDPYNNAVTILTQAARLMEQMIAAQQKAQEAQAAQKAQPEQVNEVAAAAAKTE